MSLRLHQVEWFSWLSAPLSLKRLLPFVWRLFSFLILLKLLFEVCIFTFYTSNPTSHHSLQPFSSFGKLHIAGGAAHPTKPPVIGLFKLGTNARQKAEDHFMHRKAGWLALSATGPLQGRYLAVSPLLIFFPLAIPPALRPKTVLWGRSFASLHSLRQSYFPDFLSCLQPYFSLSYNYQKDPSSFVSFERSQTSWPVQYSIHRSKNALRSYPLNLAVFSIPLSTKVPFPLHGRMPSCFPSPNLHQWIGFCLSHSPWMPVFFKVLCLRPLLFFYLLMILHQTPTLFNVLPMMPLFTALFKTHH